MVAAGLIFLAAPILIAALLRYTQRRRIVAPLRQGQPGETPMQESTPERPVFVAVGGLDLMTCCPECWGTGRALMPHSDQSWRFCECPDGDTLRADFKTRGFR